MKNIFKKAKFGQHFQTKDGKDAIYLGKDFGYCCAVQNGTGFELRKYGPHGFWLEFNLEDDKDIIPTKHVFSVSPTKKVEFTKGNLYWDGKSYHFEKKQTDYPTKWNPHHVGHFYWTSLKDYKSDKLTYKPYAHSCDYSDIDCKFFCGEDNPLTVDGISGCSVLSCDEWDYLIFDRTNASNLRKIGVSVDGKANCLIIAPDGFSGTLKSSYTLDEVNSLGLVCLPAAGWRKGSRFYSAENWGLYWSSTPGLYYSDCAYYLDVDLGSISTANFGYRNDGGHSIRLVKEVKE